MSEALLFSIQVDCEATQHSIRNPVLGERAVRGLGDIFTQTGTKGTFFVIPGDIEVHRALYIELRSQGHEIGLHVHPAEEGHGEFLGAHGAAEQCIIIREAMDRFSAVMGENPLSFCPGYFSANDFTYGVLEELGFTHGTLSCPTRNLLECAAVWGPSSFDPRYGHRFNRMLDGDVDFVELPVTVDADSRMWGGSQPLDLRVEMVDAKNHYYTIDKAVRRQIAQAAPIKQLHAITHNIFDYSDPRNFRRETYVGIVAAAREIAARQKLDFQPVTLTEVARAFRARVPITQAAPRKLTLDGRGRVFNRY